MDGRRSALRRSSFKSHRHCTPQNHIIIIIIHHISNAHLESWNAARRTRNEETAWSSTNDDQPHHEDAIIHPPSLSSSSRLTPSPTLPTASFIMHECYSSTKDRIHLSDNNKFIMTSLSLACFEKTAMSSLKDSDEQTSPPATPGSRGVQVANSHFSKMSARRGNKGCLCKDANKFISHVIIVISWWKPVFKSFSSATKQNFGPYAFSLACSGTLKFQLGLGGFSRIVCFEFWASKVAIRTGIFSQEGFPFHTRLPPLSSIIIFWKHKRNPERPAPNRPSIFHTSTHSIHPKLKAHLSQRSLLSPWYTSRSLN